MDLPENAARPDVPAESQSADEPERSNRAAVAFVLLSAVAGAVLAVPAGWLWVRLADPPSGMLTESGVLFGEVEWNQQVGVTMWFIVVGVVAGILAGLVVGFLGQRHGWLTVVAVVVLCVVAAVLTAQFGEHLFGPDEQAQAASAQAGDTITAGVDLGTRVAYLGWPIGGLIGAIGAMMAWRKGQSGPAVDPPSSSVIAHL